MPGYTTNYNVQYPIGSEPIKRQELQDLATSFDAGAHQAVLDAQSAFAGAANQAYVNAAVATGAQPLPAVALRIVGTRISQIVETRADGTTDVSTITYSGDQLLTVAQGNPSKTITFGYAGSAPTGWTVA